MILWNGKIVHGVQIVSFTSRCFITTNIEIGKLLGKLHLSLWWQHYLNIPLREKLKYKSKSIIYIFTTRAWIEKKTPSSVHLISFDLLCFALPSGVLTFKFVTSYPFLPLLYPWILSNPENIFEGTLFWSPNWTAHWLPPN